MDSNKIALEQYVSECAQAGELATFIAAFIDDHGEVAPDDVTFAHVGNMANVKTLLAQVKTFITDGPDA